MASRSKRGPAFLRGLALLIASLLVLCSLPVAGLAQTPATATWTGGTGDWSVSSNWNPATVPNGAYDVFINSGAVTLDQSASIADLTLASGQSLSASSGNVLTLSGLGGASTITNNGAITVNNAAISPGSGSLTLSGSGTLTLSNSGNLGSPSGALVNDTNHTIRGTGTMNGQITNNGTITADQSTALTMFLYGASSNSNIMQATGAGGLNINAGASSFTNTGNILAASGPVQMTGPLTNQGTMQATNATMTFNSPSLTNSGAIQAGAGGTVSFGSSSVNNTNGTISASGGGTLDLGSSTFIGGSFTATGAGSLILGSGNAYLTNVSMTIGQNAGLQVSPSQGLTVTGAITNNGAITVNNAAISPGSGSLTLSGSGTLTLSNSGNLGSPSGALVNDTNHTIRGTGTMNGQITNNGTITADQSTALTVYLNGASSNSNIMQATGAGGLNINAGASSFTNTGNILAAGGPVQMTGPLTNQGTIQATNATMTFTSPALTNSGAIQAGAGGTVSVREQQR